MSEKDNVAAELALADVVGQEALTDHRLHQLAVTIARAQAEIRLPSLAGLACTVPGADPRRERSGLALASLDPRSGTCVESRGAVSATPDADADGLRADHSGLAAKRVTVGVVGGAAAAALLLANGASWAVAVLCASDIAALAFVVLVWASVATADAVATARIARAEDASRAAAEGFSSAPAAPASLRWRSRSFRLVEPTRRRAGC